MRLAILGFALLAACSPATVTFENVEEASPAEPTNYAAVNANWNKNATATNARLREAYERGQAVCKNIAKSGRDPGKGCPRPEPDYLPLR